MLSHLNSLRQRLAKEHSKSAKKEFVYNALYLWLKLVNTYNSICKKSEPICLVQKKFNGLLLSCVGFVQSLYAYVPSLEICAVPFKASWITVCMVFPILRRNRSCAKEAQKSSRVRCQVCVCSRHDQWRYSCLYLQAGMWSLAHDQ